ncbi:MAG: signal transduction histidine kinase [Myxococcota bacterium]|jgi:signal transduction histidine kinase
MRIWVLHPWRAAFAIGGRPASERIKPGFGGVGPGLRWGLTTRRRSPFAVYLSLHTAGVLLTTATAGFLPAPIFDAATEAQRQLIIRELGLLDATEANEFEDLVEIVSLATQIPIVAVSLIDNDRQQFVARFGTDIRETARDVSFCGHAIGSDETMCVEDTHLDPRFAGNPLVVDAPHIRFYAGVPLVSNEGVRLGTLCAIDLAPRVATPEQLKILRAQGRLAMRLIDARRLTRRIAENALELAEKARSVERSQEMMRDLTDALSHELVAPVRHVISFTQRLAPQLPEGDVNVEMVLTAGRQMAMLLTALRDYGRAGGILELKGVDAGRCAGKAAAALAPEIEEAGATITIGSLPQVLGHEAFLIQVFRNLMANAVKYAAPDRPPEIFVDAVEHTKGIVKITVRDNGVGIAPRHQSSVFERLRRLHLNHVIPGSGLGLTLCKRVVDRFGGTIGLESEVDVGTTVWFTLYRS